MAIPTRAVPAMLTAREPAWVQPVAMAHSVPNLSFVMMVIPTNATAVMVIARGRIMSAAIQS